MSIEELFYTSEIDALAKAVSLELANRNRFALTDYPRHISDKPHADQLVNDSGALHAVLLGILSKQGVLKELADLPDKPSWLALALGFGSEKDGNYDPKRVAMYIGIGLIQRQRITTDDHIAHLSDAELVSGLGLSIADSALVSLSDKRLELRNHGIIFDKDTLIYPHQFLRRFYSANFVEMPFLLNKAKKAGADVSLRIDPLRKTTANRYREIFEADHWYGPPFSKTLLQDEYLNKRTVHFSRGMTCMSYDPAFTVFRTKMMDKKQREFMIEEYCPLELPYSRSSEKSPGVGTISCIQKFAHLVYDQREGCFTRSIRRRDKQEA